MPWEGANVTLTTRSGDSAVRMNVEIGCFDGAQSLALDVHLSQEAF